MEYVPAYRAPIYEHLAPLLDEAGIELRLFIGTPPPSRSGRKDAVVPKRAVFNASRFGSIRGRELTFQRLPREALSADLVVVQQEAGLVVNYLLALRSLFGYPFAVWGHGEDPNSSTRSEGIERVKRLVTRRAHWAFAYTDRSRRTFEAIGFQADRITVTNNSMSIDTTFNSEEVSPDLAELIDEIEGRTRRVGWFVSSMDEGKRLPDLLEIVDDIRSEVADFEFVFVGEGSARSTVSEFCSERSWAHDLGSRREDDKAAIGAIARLMIMPAAVGLHVLDAFAFGTPLLTAVDPSNSHELDYLDDGVNGLLLPEGSTTGAFCQAAVDLLQDEARLNDMCAAAQSSADEYSIEAMTERFADGITAAIERIGVGNDHEAGRG